MIGVVGQGWTDERVEALKAHFEEGLSCGASAKLLGGVTRSGVIGKRYRLGLTRPEISKPARAVRSPPIKAPVSRSPYKGDPHDSPLTKRLRSIAGARERQAAPDYAEAFPPIAVVPDGAIRFSDRSNRQCPFCVEPPSAPAHEHMLVCGGEVPDGEVWCPAHKARVYQATKKVSTYNPDRNVVRTRSRAAA